MRRFHVRWAAVLSLAIAVLVPASPASAANATVSVVDKAFTPSAVTIESGESVTWNFTEGTHNVRVTQGPVKFDSGFKSSGSFTRALTAGGTYTYVCDAHSEMRGTVTVNGGGAAPPPASAPATASGADTTPPVLTAGRVSALATVRLRASEAATLRIRVTRGGRTVRRGSAALRAGANRIALRVRGLRLGRYRVHLHAVDASGRRSKTVTRALVVGRAALARRIPATPPAPAAPASGPAASPAPAGEASPASGPAPADDSDARPERREDDDEREREDD